MIGLRVKYNKDMSGIIIDENSTHVVIQFDNAGKYCVPKCGLEIDKNHVAQAKAILICQFQEKLYICSVKYKREYVKP